MQSWSAVSEESDVCKEEEESETRAISLMKSTRRRRRKRRRRKMKVFSPKHAGDDDIGFNERELQTVNEGKRSESMARINQKEITPKTFSTYYRRGRRGKERKNLHCHFWKYLLLRDTRQKNPDDFGSPQIQRRNRKKNANSSSSIFCGRATPASFVLHSLKAGSEFVQRRRRIPESFFFSDRLWSWGEGEVSACGRSEKTGYFAAPWSSGRRSHTETQFPHQVNPIAFFVEGEKNVKKSCEMRSSTIFVLEVR